MRRMLIFFVIVMCVAGCMVGPDYKRPSDRYAGVFPVRA